MTGTLADPVVAVVKDRAAYSGEPPFDPSEAFPEWPGLPVSATDNPGYRAVRRALHALDLDPGRRDTPDWNPLEGMARPGGTVVVKPNLVTHANHAARHDPAGTDCLVTHGSVIRAAMDYVAKALRGRGKILLCDCPLQGAKWDRLMAVTGIPAIRESLARRFPDLEIEVRDLRLGTAREWHGQVVERVVDESERSRYLEVDLARRSLLLPLMDGPYAFGVTHYGRRRMRAAHSPDRNCYLLPLDVLRADAIVNLPKMKAHQKAGITCSLKNLVGINGHKDYLPHFRFGSPRRGGDEYPDAGWPWDLVSAIAHADWELEGGLVKRLLVLAGGALRRTFVATGLLPREQAAMAGGAWHGNDTLWRMVLDINRALLHFDPATNALGSGPGPIGYLSILDGLVAGQGEGPLAPTPHAAGVVLAGRNPVAVDAAAAAVMGFDPARVAHVARGFDIVDLPLTTFRPADVVLRGDLPARDLRAVHELGCHHRFEPSVGFRGHLEWERHAPEGRAGAAAGA